MRGCVAVLACLTSVLWAAGVWAGPGLHDVSAKVGLDVVEANDTRHFYVLQADVATLFSPKVRLELSGEMGRGADLNGTDIEVVGVSGVVKYLWANKRRTVFAFTGGGLGFSRFQRWRTIPNEVYHETDITLHYILVGLERHAFKGRVKGIFEVRLVLGSEEDASALRTAVGLGFVLKKP